MHRDTQDFRRDGHGQRWSKMVMKSGTLADRLAALTLDVKRSPHSGLGSLDSLLAMLKKKGRREALMALDAVAALFREQLLQSDRKLIKFESRKLADLEQKNKQDREGLLSEWYLEDQIKERYFSFILLLDGLLKDQQELTRLKVMGVVFDLLVEKPEREDKLLEMLVNKLGDPEKKVASKACGFLVRVLQQHPNMKLIVVEEVERLLYRTNVSPKAQYYAVCFLVQIKLADTENALAVRLVKIYFSLFKAATAKKISNPKMVSAILTGVNRTYPFTKGPQNLLDHIDHLFRYIHTVTAQVGIQILMLLYQVMEREGAITDRFYMALYRKMMDSDLLQHSGRSSSLLNLLYKSMKRDPETMRVKAFIKRILQLAMTQSTPFICGALIVISEVLKSKPNSFRAKLFQAPSVSSTAAPVKEEHSKEGTSRLPITDYSAAARNPLFCGAEFAPIWELRVLSQHYHPSVCRFADNILRNKPLDYAGDPFEDFTAIHFLDRFVYRNPKKRTEDGQSGARDMPVLSDQYLNLPEKKIPDDERFLHRYLTQRLKQKKVAVGHDDMDAASDVSDSEFDKFLDDFEKNEVDEDLDFAADMNDVSEERGSIDEDGSLFGDDDDDESVQGDFSAGEKDALNAAFSDSDGEEGDDGDDAMGDFADAPSDEDAEDYDDEMDFDDD
ncbi:CCAAT/enhancer-binding protein zeta [Hypsibius exemplaris]|uniref:CCAAT/enhancer-binding protein zeta n=1 Tax=Hypsibius exemplaris TaxID=2072580 RepID=A0A1W0X4M7_HYPEX|nr:CCAAT/enhancer-binding protein zeta [Hypsibius exemplaris]